MDTPLTGLSSVTSIPLPESPLASDGKPAGASSTHLLRFRSIYILPTRQGVGFAVAVLAMLLGSINYGNALGYVLSFILIGAGLVSMLHAVRNLSGLGLGRHESAPVFAGDMARFGVRVDNRGQRQRFGLLARLTSGRRRSRERDSVLHFHLDADSVKHIELAGVAARRGWYSPGPVTIATRFPFGLFRAWTGKEIGLRCLVFPRPAGEQALPLYRPEESGDQGRSGKGDDEFSGLRDYQQGDSARRVHWKAVARGQRMPVKVFSGATSGVIMLRWQDVVADDTESRLSQLSRWVVDADAQGLRYGLCLPGVDLPADGSHTHRQRCLEALALFDAAVSP
jgi:uncharacterized protein (DUF58 family)